MFWVCVRVLILSRLESSLHRRGTRKYAHGCVYRNVSEVIDAESVMCRRSFSGLIFLIPGIGSGRVME